MLLHPHFISHFLFDHPDIQSSITSLACLCHWLSLALHHNLPFLCLLASPCPFPLNPPPTLLHLSCPDDDFPSFVLSSYLQSLCLPLTSFNAIAIGPSLSPSSIPWSINRLCPSAFYDALLLLFSPHGHINLSVPLQTCIAFQSFNPFHFEGKRPWKCFPIHVIIMPTPTLVQKTST